MYIVGLDVDSRAYFTSATCAISLLYLMNTLVFLQIFSNKYKYNKNNNNNNYIKNHSKFKFIYSFSQKRNYKTNSLIIYNNQVISYSLTKGILSKIEREKLKINDYQKSIIIGLILSDGWLRLKKGWNSKLGFKQSLKNFYYCWFIYNNLKNLCSNTPYLNSNLIRGRLFYSVQFETRQLKSLNFFKELFYNDKTKIIKDELIFHLNEIALAHWIMGDGARRNNGITLCTDNFSLYDVVKLINMLYIKFNIKCTLHKEKNHYRIYINKKEWLKIKDKVKPYIIKDFYYKIN